MVVGLTKACSSLLQLEASYKVGQSYHSGEILET